MKIYFMWLLFSGQNYIYSCLEQFGIEIHNILRICITLLQFSGKMHAIPWYIEAYIIYDNIHGI